MKNNIFLRKTKELLIGKRTIKERIPTAFWPVFSLTFILILFGPLDLSHIAETYVSYSVLDVLPSCLQLFCLCLFIGFIILLVIGGKLHSLLSSLISGLALAFYVQGNWLNVDLGVLDGNSVEWDKYGDNAIIGFVVFLLITQLPFLVHFYSRKIWKKFIVFISILLIFMQGVPLGLMLIREFKNRPPADHYIMKKDKEFVLGKENIVTFILDQTAPTHIKWLNTGYPNSLDPFNDFTYFTNFNTNYMGTFPASAYLLTHEPYDWTIPTAEWFEKAWHSKDAESFYDQMKSNNWSIRVFNSSQHAAGTLKNEYGKISNVEKRETRSAFQINRSVFRKLIKLSFYRYFPLIMKAPFWIYTGDLDAMKIIPEDEQTWNRIESVQKFLEEGLTLGEEEKVYVTYHWIGAHSPYYLDAQGRTSKTSSQVTQLAGQFYVISEYIKRMKDLQIYDNSTIIITTDHGDFEDPNSILFIKPANQRQEEMLYSNAPVSQAEFMETIADAAGLEKGQFGDSFFDISEDIPRERCTYIRWYDPSYPDFPGKGTNAIQEYCYTGDIDTVIEMVKDKNFISYPLADAWY